jgi:hypothetical protein
MIAGRLTQSGPQKRPPRRLPPSGGTEAVLQAQFWIVPES